MGNQQLHGLTIKTAFVLGFSLTLGLWLFTGYDISRRMGVLQRDVAAANTRYMRAQDLLSTVRAQVLLGSVYVRDALLDASPMAAEGSLRRLQETSHAIDRALAQYVPVLDSDAERERVGRLREELLDFRTTLSAVLATDRSHWPDRARTLLNEQVVPHRETVIRVSEDVQALNRQAFVRQQTALAAVYDAAERRTWQRLGIALAGSLSIALLATVYGTRLEQRLRRQRDKDLQNTSDLQRLSAQLITAQEDERRTIARELHDEVGQVLTAIKMELSVAQRAIDSAGVPGRPLQSAQTITDSALHSVRDLSRLLHPSLLDDLGLPAAVRAYTGRFSERHGIRVDLQVEGMDARIEGRLEAAVYRIMQESLTNIARHAGVTTCRIRLVRSGDRLQLTVQDDGRGFDPREREGATSRRGLGLIGMRERATQFGGRFILDSAPGRGTRVSVDFPVTDAEPHFDSRATSDVLPG
ncbi:MAG TPA: ATP-binding protein [Vicinamibacterales bacterium]|nr:ATP-binding protein [Vicinamibacterales bacterium]